MRSAPLGLSLALLAVAGCTAPAGEPPADAPAASSARVGLTDFSVTSRPVSVLPGAVRLDVTNAGATVHDLVVRGSSGEWRTPLLRSGEAARLEIRGEPGERLELWCSVAGHEAAGMRGVLTVAR